MINTNNKRRLNFEFRHLLLVAALATFVVIVFGVLVRVTEGQGCPDWPTCYGSWTAPVQSSALLDYVHRTVTFIAGLLGLSALGWGWLFYRSSRLIFVPLALSALVFVAEVALSAAGVVGLLPEALESSLHLGLALLIFGLQLMAVAASFKEKVPERLRFRTPFARLSLATLLAVFVLLLSGTLVSVSGATTHCQGWPFCNPVDLLGWLNLAHRVIVAVSGILVALLFGRAWQTQRSQTVVLVTATSTGVLFTAQALMGAVEVTRNFPPHLLALHTATSAAVFATATLTAVFSGLISRQIGDEQLEHAQWRNRSTKRMIKDLLLLTKPIVVLLLLVTTYAGMVIGARSWPSLSLTFWTLLGGFMAAGGSGAINQYIDRMDDTRMQRTQTRPIPSGRLTPAEGLAFGVALTLGSFYILVAFVNLLAAMLSLAGIVYYVLLYSIFLKKTTVQNIVIGGGAGAIPPLVGWAAATGSLNIPSLFLFAIVFMWTPPHFWALAIVRRKDYARAGVPMLPVIRGEGETRKQIFIYTVELVLLTLLIPLFGLGGSIYFVLAAILGLWLLGAAWKVWKREGNNVAWKMYRYSSMYLAFIFAALMVDALL
jgi:protoheme IX farnesyltransferase